jgi:diguanylate cyclase (GGDEF)-like protein
MPSHTFQPRLYPLTSLATKIILFVFLSTFVTALVVSWISIQSTHDSVRGVIDRHYPQSLAHAELRAAPWLAVARTELEALATDPELKSPAGATRALAGTLERRTSHWLGLAWIDAAGAVVAGAGEAPADAGPQLASRPSRVALAGGGSAPALWMPIAGRGALVGLLDGDALGALLAAHLPDPECLLAVADREGRVLAAAGGRRHRLDRIELPGPTSPARRTVEYASAGRRVIGAAIPLGADGWWLVVESPFEAAFAPVLDVVSRIFVIDLGVILLFSFLAYRVTSTVVRPIERLSDWARRIAQGQLDLEIPETGGRDEIGLLARTFNDMVRQLRRNQHDIETANRDLTDRNLRLQQANEVLNQLSITDGLTKLHNHRFFQDHLTREIKRVSRSHEPLSILLIDIDDFKQLNDRFGHAAGDELLTRMAPLLNTAVRETDLVARYGGEEFVILALNTDARGAWALAEKVRTAIAESSFILDDSLRPLRVTVSIGVAQFRGNRKRFFQKADEALYRAKAEGKNCTVVDAEDTREADASDADE